ncbi:dUTPase [Anoxybacillus flavithermus]|uniref:Phage-encoded dCTP pyrophosphatase n=1 Tax=Anoxybacillus flavithermus (strain DSM 21510 / WK1) TaxID=491915 RepID=B7GIM0_ANOFW|nr:dUTPase [Anoxybacillus flavithermus]ACJ33035.1 Phage-encoded dCTP pyrophosphatase [Anoxybacillus flavithermus WK1]
MLERTTIECLRKLILKANRHKNLEVMFNMQQALDERIIAERNIDKTIDEWVVAITIAMESEIDEIRREVNWKWWKQEKEVDIDRLQEEVIDLWHFLLSLSRIVGLTPETIFERYMQKNTINHKRQDGGY